MLIRLIPGFEWYAVSKDGRVWSRAPRGKAKEYSKWTSVFIWVDSKGYNAVSLVKDGTRKSFSVHGLMARAYLGGVPSGYTVNHKDGVKTNSHLDNLEVVTHKQNIQHAWDTGLQTKKFGSENVAHKLCEAEVLCIKILLSVGYKRKRLSDMFSVSWSCIRDIDLGLKWKQIKIK